MNAYLDMLLSFLYRFIAAGAAAYLTYAVVRQLAHWQFRRGVDRAMDDFLQVASEQPAKIGSSEYKIRSFFRRFSIDVSGQEERAVRNAQILLGLAGGIVFAAAGLPLLISLLVGGSIGYSTVPGAIRSHWDKIRGEIEKDIPTFLRNLAGVLRTERNVLDAVVSAVQAVDEQRPLHPWVMYLAEELRSYGVSAIERLQSEAFEISSALGLVVFEIGRMMQTGGEGYMDAFLNAANNLSELIEVRGEAHTEAAQATGLVRAAILLAMVIYGVLLYAPAGRRILIGSLASQLVLAGSVIWAVIGWNYIRAQIREVTA